VHSCCFFFLSNSSPTHERTNEIPRWGERETRFSGGGSSSFRWCVLRDFPPLFFSKSREITLLDIVRDVTPF
jgi:hypothetical protein